VPDYNTYNTIVIIITLMLTFYFNNNADLIINNLVWQQKYMKIYARFHRQGLDYAKIWP